MLAGPALLRMVHTRHGAYVGCAVMSYGTPKDRKKAVKAMKGAREEERDGSESWGWGLWRLGVWEARMTMWGVCACARVCARVCACVRESLEVRGSHKSWCKYSCSRLHTCTGARQKLHIHFAHQCS